MNCYGRDNRVVERASIPTRLVESRQLLTALIRERLDLRDGGGGAVYEADALCWFQGDVHREDIAGPVEAEVVHRLDEGSIDVVDLDAASARSGAGEGLGDEEELVDGIELDGL